jgi:transcriptional regulator with XRE-family HTH domain
MSTQQQDSNVISLRWEPTIDFALRIRALRKEYGRHLGHKVDQYEMAELLDVPVGTYKGWESGNSKPADLVGMAKRIEAVTGVRAAWILDVADEGPHAPNPNPGQEILPLRWNDEPAGAPFVIGQLDLSDVGWHEYATAS